MLWENGTITVVVEGNIVLPLGADFASVESASFGRCGGSGGWVTDQGKGKVIRWINLF
jgi:hypothetical protein